MTPSDSPALALARLLLRLLMGFNLLVGAMLVLALPASFVFEPVFVTFFTKTAARIDPSWLMPTLRLWLVLALPLVAAVHISLTRLLAIVATVDSGDPFVPENAVRLKTIAWCTLGTQVFELVNGAMAATMNAAGSHIDWHWTPTGWLGVVLLFVLARVFQEGARLRDDAGSVI